MPDLRTEDPEIFTVTPADRPAARPERTRVGSAPRFGETFTDHMVCVDWSTEAGWTNARVTGLEPVALHPAAAVLHYGQEIFEGLKVYRHPDGSLRTFRPRLNAERFQRSAARLAMPELPVDLFLESIEQLVALDAAWVPEGRAESLYLRPFMFATEPFLGIRPARRFTYALIASPSGAYFEEGSDGVRLWLSSLYSRAGRGGTGHAKCGGNYAASLLAQLEAQEHGCDQALFTDADTHLFVEEAGAMNIFFVLGDRLVTPPTSGTILAGVTRRSIIELGASLGLRADIRPFSVEEWAGTAGTRELTEVFAAGTAAGVVPVTELVAPRGSIPTPTVGWGPVARQVSAELEGVQLGTRPDRFGWMHELRSR